MRRSRHGFATAETLDHAVIATLANPIAAEGGLAILRGSLAPNGAVIKQSAATPALLRHRGPALVFEDVYDVAARIDDPDLDVDADTVLVLRNSGPRGGPGMPEWGTGADSEEAARPAVSATWCGSPTRA